MNKETNVLVQYFFEASTKPTFTKEEWLLRRCAQLMEQEARMHEQMITHGQRHRGSSVCTTETPNTAQTNEETANNHIHELFKASTESTSTHEEWLLRISALLTERETISMHDPHTKQK